jgi:predicted AAA+ superfamily ATPase
MNYLTSIVGRNKEERMTVFIDEIQYMDNPTSFLKSIYDEYENIKFIVSGSSTLEIRKKLKDSLA